MAPGAKRPESIESESASRPPLGEEVGAETGVAAGEVGAARVGAFSEESTAPHPEQKRLDGCAGVEQEGQAIMGDLRIVSGARRLQRLSDHSDRGAGVFGAGPQGRRFP
jgi:hypothetical protein